MVVRRCTVWRIGVVLSFALLSIGCSSDHSLSRNFLDGERRPAPPPSSTLDSVHLQLAAIWSRTLIDRLPEESVHERGDYRRLEKLREEKCLAAIPIEPSVTEPLSPLRDLSAAQLDRTLWGKDPALALGAAHVLSEHTSKSAFQSLVRAALASERSVDIRVVAATSILRDLDKLTEAWPQGEARQRFLILMALVAEDLSITASPVRWDTDVLWMELVLWRVFLLSSCDSSSRTAMEHLQLRLESERLNGFPWALHYALFGVENTLWKRAGVQDSNVAALSEYVRLGGNISDWPMVRACMGPIPPRQVLPWRIAWLERLVTAPYGIGYNLNARKTSYNAWVKQYW